RQQDVPIRNFERPTVPSRFSNREQARGEADSTTNWRKGQVSQRDRDQSVGKQPLMEKRGEPSGAQLHDVKAVATPSPADAGPWRRGMIVAQQTRRDEQDKERRAVREAQRPPKREIVENSEIDSDWRKNAQPAQPRIIPSKPFGERFVEGERYRESGAVTASEADSGPWVRGNVTGSQRQQDVPIRNFERPTVPSRFSNREQARGEADSTTNWRKGQVSQRDRDQSVGK
ncbi:hypothetical protein WUBG_17526, partial [Wuchereria bancrofti]